MLSGTKKQVLIDYLTEIVRRVHDPRVRQLTSTHYQGDEQNAHPTRAQHRATARDFVPQLRALMSWQR